MADRFLQLRDVLHLTSLSKSQIYRLIASGGFPKPVALGSRKAYLESEVVAWQDARIAERAAA